MMLSLTSTTFQPLTLIIRDHKKPTLPLGRSQAGAGGFGGPCCDAKCFCCLVRLQTAVGPCAGGARGTGSSREGVHAVFLRVAVVWMY